MTDILKASGLTIPNMGYRSELEFKIYPEPVTTEDKAEKKAYEAARELAVSTAEAMYGKGKELTDTFTPDIWAYTVWDPLARSSSENPKLISRLHAFNEARPLEHISEVAAYNVLDWLKKLDLLGTEVDLSLKPDPFNPEKALEQGYNLEAVKFDMRSLFARVAHYKEKPHQPLPQPEDSLGLEPFPSPQAAKHKPNGLPMERYTTEVVLQALSPKSSN